MISEIEAGCGSISIAGSSFVHEVEITMLIRMAAIFFVQASIKCLFELYYVIL